MKKQWIRTLAVGFSFLALVACNKSPTAVAPVAGDVGGPDAQAYGQTGHGGFYGQGNFKLDADGKRINPLTAPANNSYYFDYDSNNIGANDSHAMSIQAGYLATHPSAKVRLEGNTDNRGSREYNIGLGWRRDQAVAAYLEQQGVKASQIQMVSYGKERPLALGNDEHSWMLNRRVDLVYTNY